MAFKSEAMFIKYISSKNSIHKNETIVYTLHHDLIRSNDNPEKCIGRTDNSRKCSTCNPPSPPPRLWIDWMEKNLFHENSIWFRMYTY